MNPPTGMTVNGKTIRPWKRSCWDDDGRPVEHGPDCCYHDQWVRIASDNAMVAWVERSKSGRFEAYAWDPELEDHVELCVHLGGYANPRNARRGADRALVRFIESCRGGHS